jgi:hypothetical protein
MTFFFNVLAITKINNDDIFNRQLHFSHTTCLKKSNFHTELQILKVHKTENFFDYDFGICVISLLVMSKYEDLKKKFFDWAIIGGGTIFPRSPRTTQNEKKF